MKGKKMKNVNMLLFSVGIVLGFSCMQAAQPSRHAAAARPSRHSAAAQQHEGMIRVVPYAVDQQGRISILLLYGKVCGPVSYQVSHQRGVREEIMRILRSIHLDYTASGGTFEEMWHQDRYFVVPVVYKKVTEMNEDYEYIWFNCDQHMDKSGHNIQATRFGKHISINLHPEFVQFLSDKWRGIKAQILGKAGEEAPAAPVAKPIAAAPVTPAPREVAPTYRQPSYMRVPYVISRQEAEDALMSLHVGISDPIIFEESNIPFIRRTVLVNTVLKARHDGILKDSDFQPGEIEALLKYAEYLD
jgi:hypothetical protein